MVVEFNDLFCIVFVVMENCWIDLDVESGYWIISFNDFDEMGK